MKQREVTAGQIVSFSEGEYDDYRIIGTFRVVQSYNHDNLLGMYLNAHPEQAGTDGHFEPYYFMRWLEDLGVITAFPIEEFHLGSYNIPPEARPL